MHTILAQKSRPYNMVKPKIEPRQWNDEPLSTRIKMVLSYELKQLRDIADEIDHDSATTLESLRRLEKRGIVESQKLGPHKRDAVFFKLAVS